MFPHRTSSPVRQQVQSSGTTTGLVEAESIGRPAAEVQLSLVDLQRSGAFVRTIPGLLLTAEAPPPDIHPFSVDLVHNNLLALVAAATAGAGKRQPL